MPLNRRHWLYVLALVVCVAQRTWATELEPPLQFGVLNQQSAIQTAERWNPILGYLTRKTGIPLQLKMGATVVQTNAMMGRGEFDLAYTNHNFRTEYDGTYRVLARWGGPPIHGVIAVLDASPLRTLDDLRGRTVAFPSSGAFVAYAVPMAALRQAGVTVVEKFAGHQDGALAQLKAQQVEAVAVNSRFLEAYAAREGLALRNVYASEPFHELPILVHPRVPAERVAALQAALLAMRHDADGAAVLAGSHCPGFEAATERDYDNVRHIYRMIGQ